MNRYTDNDDTLCFDEEGRTDHWVRFDRIFDVGIQVETFGDPVMEADDLAYLVEWINKPTNGVPLFEAADEPLVQPLLAAFKLVYRNAERANNSARTWWTRLSAAGMCGGELTNTEVAKIVGIDRETLVKWENATDAIIAETRGTA